MGDPTSALTHLFSMGHWSVIERCTGVEDLRRRIRTIWRPSEGSITDRAVADRGLIVHRWMKAHEGSFDWGFEGPGGDARATPPPDVSLAMDAPDGY
jgi:hypothetical protein